MLVSLRSGSYAGLAFVFFLAWSGAFAQDARPSTTAQDLSTLLRGLPGWRVEPSCPQATYTVDSASDVAEFCLQMSRMEQERCEIALYGPDIRNKRMRLSYDIALSESWPAVDDWVIVSQVHSRPDSGEAWRCPLMSTEVVGDTLRMFSRSDQRRISDTSKSPCSGGSIRSQNVFQNVPISRGAWLRVVVDMNLSLSQGYVTASINDRVVGTVDGATTYNDAAAPFLKFGIYKRPPRATSGVACVRYRNIKLVQER